MLLTKQRMKTNPSFYPVRVKKKNLRDIDYRYLDHYIKNFLLLDLQWAIPHAIGAMLWRGSPSRTRKLAKSLVKTSSASS